jgi:cysteine sulfinate desulfinase/cysteine desulfurase-like protein
MGLDDALARASLRFGLGRFTTAGEIDRAIEAVVEALERVRARAGTAARPSRSGETSITEVGWMP